MTFEVPSPKQHLIDSKIAEVENFKDRLAHPVDKKITEAVAMLQLSGFNTTASCEGHIDEPGLMTPWIDVGASNEPEYRYKNEQQITDAILSEFGINKDTMLDGETEEAVRAWEKIVRTFTHVEETEEYKQWTAENQRLSQKMKEIIVHYHEKNEVPKEEHIMIQERGDGSVRIHTGGEDFNRNSTELTESEKEEMRDQLRRRQNAMNSFIQYLKECFLDS